MPRRAAALVVGLALADLFLHAYPYARPMPAFDYPRTPAIEAVTDLLEEGGRFVAVTPDPAVPVPDVFPPNTGAACGLEDARMTGALRPRALMERWGEVRLPHLHPNVLLAGKADAPFWDDLGVRAVVTKPGTPVPDRYRLAYQDPSVQVWERPVRGETASPVPEVFGRADRAAGVAGPLLFIAGAGLFVAALLAGRSRRATGTRAGGG
jgi:hypothetical protein